MLLAPIFIFCFFAVAQGESPGPEDGGWVSTWGCAPVFPIGEELADQTLRQFVRISVGGNRVRIRLSNETGTQPLVIGTAHLAIAGPEKGSIDLSSDRVLTFNGSAAITVPPGAPVLSDPVDFEVRPLMTLAISLYITRETGTAVIHPLGNQTAYLSQSGDQSGASTIADATTVTERYFLTRIEVSSPHNTGAIVALGDSITGGLKQLIARAHARQVKILGATLLPDEGGISYTAEGEAKRKAVNEWIRTSKAFDEVIDFEAVVRDPDHPTRVRPEYDSGDHGHLNDAGYRAMADSIDLKLFANP